MYYLNSYRAGTASESFIGRFEVMSELPVPRGQRAVVDANGRSHELALSVSTTDEKGGDNGDQNSAEWKELNLKIKKCFVHILSVSIFVFFHVCVFLDQ